MKSAEDSIKVKGIKGKKISFKIPDKLRAEFETERRIVFPIELVTVPIPWETLKKIKNVEKLQKELELNDLVLVPIPRSMIK